MKPILCVWILLIAMGLSAFEVGVPQWDVTPNSQVNIPIYIQNLEGNYFSYQFNLYFHPQFMTYVDYEKQGTMSENALVMVGNHQQFVTIACASAEPLPIDTVLVYLQFAIAESAHGYNYLTIDNFFFNDTDYPDAYSDGYLWAPGNEIPQIISTDPDTLIQCTTATAVTFSVSATDANDDSLQYHWFKDDVRQPDSLATFTTSFANTGDYWVKVHVDDGLGGISQWEWHVQAAGSPTENITPNIQTEINLTNYPNPFNPETTIQFRLPQAGNVELTVYNVIGQQVKTLLSKNCEAGDHSIIWNGQNETGENVASGLYFYRLNINGEPQAVKKMMLMK